MRMSRCPSRRSGAPGALATSPLLPHLPPASSSFHSLLPPGSRSQVSSRTHRHKIDLTASRERGREGDVSISSRNRILSLNGFHPPGLEDDKAEELMEGLLEEAESQYSYERQVRPHKLSELTRYLYKYSDTEWSTTKQKEHTFCAETEGSKMASLSLPASAGSSHEVKVENPAYSFVQGKLRVLKSAKALLEKCASQMLDTKEELIQKSRQAEHLKKPAQELQDVIGKLPAFQDELRAFCTQASLVTIKDECRPLQDRVEGFIAGAQAHQEGWKSMQKRMRALL